MKKLNFFYTAANFFALASLIEMASANQQQEQNPNHGKFEEYARAVQTLSRTADSDHRAVISLMRIPAGTTIEARWLQLVPLIEYQKTDGLPKPYLVRRSKEQFGSIAEVAGKVALKEIQEQAKVLRSQVGAKPSDQFQVTPETSLAIHYYFRRGVVLPGAPTEIHECTLSTSKMTPADAAELRKRIIRSGILEGNSEEYQLMAGGYENYSIEITIDSVTKKISWSGNRAPASVQQLVKYLESHSKKKSIPASEEFLRHH